MPKHFLFKHFYYPLECAHKKYPLALAKNYALYNPSNTKKGFWLSCAQLNICFSAYKAFEQKIM